MAKRQYGNDYVSVTQVLGILRKIGLEQWFLSNTREFCNRESKRGRESGTDIHNAIEQFINTGEAKVESIYYEEVMNGLKSFMLFKKERPDIETRTSEIALTSEKYKFNGTIDSVSPPILVDWKGGNCKSDDKPRIFDEAKAQVSAYTILWNEHNPNNLINKAYIVALGKDKIAYNIYKMDLNEIIERFDCVFVPALCIKNYELRQKQLAKERKNG